jgi:hypothetical protein
MVDILKFDKDRRDGAVYDAIEITRVDVLISDGSTNRVAFIKNKETGEIGVGLARNCKPDESHYPEVIKLCDDKDNAIYDMIMAFTEE